MVLTVIAVRCKPRTVIIIRSTALAYFVYCCC